MLENAPEQALDIEALLALSEEDLATLPSDVAGQAQELIAAHKEAAAQEAKEQQQRLTALGQRIVGVYHDRVGQRTELEQRWLEDIRRYNGEYEPKVDASLQKRTYGSKMFVPLTRRIVDIVEARMVDLLFPTEERSFSIDPSPVPMLLQAEALATRLPPDMMVPAGPDGQPLEANQIVLGIKEQREEARAKAENMQREIDDQLREANYHAVARRAIHEAMVIGTGIIKGPMVIGRTKKVWQGGSLQTTEDLSPTVVDVSLWDYFPDMSARTTEESESDIETHRMTKVQFARLAGQPGFSAAQDEIRRILSTESVTNNNTARDEMRAASGTQAVKDNRYLVLEYHGPVERQELVDAGAKVPDDNLLIYEGVIWVYEGDGTVLKALVNPMDTEARPYSTYCWRKDPASIFGFGLSGELADNQEGANSSIRAAMDHMGLLVGGMVGVNDKAVRPEDGRWSVEPNKVWRGQRPDVDMTKAFVFYDMPSKLGEIMAVFDRNKALMDDIGGPGMAMQGQDAPSYLETARGVGIAWNASNIWFRRGVTNWDDDITSPLVGRFVDWNHQYNPKDEIKGDVQVIARGRSALLEAEGQMQKMQIFGQAAQAVPMPFKRRINQLKAMGRSMRIDTTELLPDDAEIKAIAEKVDNQPPPVDPAIERLKMRQAELADNEAQRAHEKELKSMEFNLRAGEIAANERITIEAARQKYGLEQFKVTTEMENAREQRSHEAQALNAELTTKLQTGSGI